jgi:hypothetical protein
MKLTILVDKNVAIKPFICYHYLDINIASEICGDFALTIIY